MDHGFPFPEYLCPNSWQVIGKNRNTSQFPTVDYNQKKQYHSRIKKTNNLS